MIPTLRKDGFHTGDYLTDTGMTVQKNLDGDSYTSYSDLAAAMADFAEQGSFDRTFVSVSSARGRAKP